MVEHQVAGGFAFDHAVEAGFFQNGADAAGGVVDDQNLRAQREDVAHLADNSLRGDDCHAGLQSVARTFIYVEHARLLAGAGADDLRGQGAADKFFFEIEQRLQAMGLVGIFVEARLSDAQLFVLIAQCLILMAQRANVHIVVPGGACALTDGMKQPFDGSDDGGRPKADEAHRAGVGMLWIQRALDLDGQSQQLREQHGAEDHGIAVAVEKTFHGFGNQRSAVSQIMARVVAWLAERCGFIVKML